MADHGNSSNPADKVIDLDLVIRYRACSSSGDRAESKDYIIEMKADILAEGNPGPRLPQLEIHLGSFTFLIIRVGGAIDSGFPRHELFDISQEICDLAGDLYEPSYEEFNALIAKRFPDALPWDDILYFQSLELLPFARGQRVGLSALHRAAKDWESGCGLVAIQPYPLQYQNGKRNDDTLRRLGMEDFTPGFKTSKKKLEIYYKQLGFEKVGRSKFMFRCPAARAIELKVPRSIRLQQSMIDAHARLAGNV